MSLWHNGMKTGIEAVDEDHRTLFAMLEGLNLALSDSSRVEWTLVIDLVERLSRYAQEHFWREEAIQEEVGYDGLDENRRQHQELLRTLTAFSTRLKHEPDTDPHRTAETMRSFLTVWVTEHIVKVDCKMRGRILPWCG